MEMVSADQVHLKVVSEDTAPWTGGLLGQHGLSIYVEVRKGDRTTRLLVDAPPNYAALSHNIKALGVELEALDGILLTHCHYDHTGGLLGVLADAAKTDLPVIAHPRIFRPNLHLTPCISHVGVPSEITPESIASHGGRLILCRDPIRLGPGISTTGEVPRVSSFEGSSIEVYTVADGHMHKDAMECDTSLIVNIEARGLVIITGCSHAGIVNIVEQAKALFSNTPIDGILGGLHLVSSNLEVISKTVESLSATGVRWISAGHCTGFAAQIALYQTFGDRFSLCPAGWEFSVERA